MMIGQLSTTFPGRSVSPLVFSIWFTSLALKDPSQCAWV
jgi:hypothetical protein